MIEISKYYVRKIEELFLDVSILNTEKNSNRWNFHS